MASILYVGEDARTAQDHALALHAAGYAVDLEQNQISARGRLDGPAADVVIVDAPDPDGGGGLLVRQAREAWGTALVLVLIRQGNLRDTAVEQMGLWDPHATLVHPVSGDRLVARVNALLEGDDAMSA